MRDRDPNDQFRAFILVWAVPVLAVALLYIILAILGW